MIHGTQYAYRHGCHCDECRKWNRESKQKWRRNRINRGEVRLVNGKWVEVRASQ